MTAVIGIDPGFVGAIALVVGRELRAVHDMPTIPAGKTNEVNLHAVRDILVEFGPVDLVVLEHVNGIQGSGATSAFNFGAGWGGLRGLLVALDRPHQLVRPPRWTKDMAVGRDKAAHRRAAAGFYPEHAHLFARVKDDGRADATLLARWGMQQ